MLTEILALYAAITATVTLFVTYQSYRSDNPRISGRMTAVVSRRKDFSATVTMSIKIYNKGRAVTTIEDPCAYYFPNLIWYPRYHWRVIEIPSQIEPRLPFPIEGNFNFKTKIKGNLASPDKGRFGTVIFQVDLKTGERIKIKSRVENNQIPDL